MRDVPSPLAWRSQVIVSEDVATIVASNLMHDLSLEYKPSSHASRFEFRAVADSRLMVTVDIASGVAFPIVAIDSLGDSIRFMIFEDGQIGKAHSFNEHKSKHAKVSKFYAEMVMSLALTAKNAVIACEQEPGVAVKHYEELIDARYCARLDAQQLAGEERYRVAILGE